MVSITDLWSKYGLTVPNEDIEIIQAWIKQQPHLPDEIDVLLIKKFLTRCTSIQQAKRFIDSFFTMRHFSPEVFKNRDPLSPRFQKVHSSVQLVMLPSTTKEGFKICVSRVIDPDANTYMFEDTIKYVTMLHDLRLATEPDNIGDIWIFDCENMSTSFLARMSLSLMKKYLNYNQYAQPLKVYQTHITNCNPMLDTLINLIKPMLHPIGQKLIYTHRPNSTTLYEYLPRDVLPAEFGGTYSTMKEIAKTNIKTIVDNRDFFLNLDKLWYMDESKRPATAVTPKMDEGSFKSLSFD